MKAFFTRYVVTIPVLVISTYLPAQCLPGYSQAELNWDHLDFLPSDNTRYTSFYPSAAFPYSQYFTMGPRKVNFVLSPAANIILSGENGTNTAHAGSFATAGDDVKFTTTTASATSIQMNVDADIANIQFSLFDLDVSQSVTITAKNAMGVDQPVVITKANAASAVNITGSGTVSATSVGPAANYTDNDNQGTINISIAGPANRINIALTTATGDIWLSDIAACITGAFPVNYQQVSRPFTGQPQYVLTVVNNRIYYTDPTNGTSYFLFTEPGHDRLNSMAYDPVKRVVYYTYSLTDRVGLNPQNDKVLKKYDVDTKTISVVMPDVNAYGIPTYESGVESGAATFYNGSLYLGVEGYTGTTGSGAYAASRKSTIWKIDFDASGNPVSPAAQVFGVLSDDGVDAQNIHDWSDFGISDGVLYDFDGSGSGDIDYYHFNLMTGARSRYAPTGGVIPRQVSIGWDEKLYNVDAAISLYNGTNGVGTAFTINAPLGPAVPNNGSWGDAAGPYRPFLDFGDAPASYDPDQWSPACHDTLTPTVSGRRTKLRMGANEDVEWLKKGFTTVEDNYEDGLSFVPIYSPVSGTYTIQVSVFNNTGSNARVGAWLDFNGNGLFDPAEGMMSANIVSSASQQTINLSWSGLPNLLPGPSYTYLRLRIVPAASGMTANNATGYYNIGEVEDYRIVVDNLPLSMQLLSFEAASPDNSVIALNWKASEEILLNGYNVQRSTDAVNWETIYFQPASNNSGVYEYTFLDKQPYAGRSLYRLQLRHAATSVSYSKSAIVNLSGMMAMFSIGPNPAVNEFYITLENKEPRATASVRIMNLQGSVVSVLEEKLVKGRNSINVQMRSTWPSGEYVVQVITTGGGMHSKKIYIRR